MRYEFEGHNSYGNRYRDRYNKNKKMHTDGENRPTITEEDVQPKYENQ